MNRPIIFLDFDGVLITKQCYLDRRCLHEKASPACVDALNDLLASTHASIVVSSSWRGVSVTPMQRLLALWGVHGHVVGVTPQSEYQEQRGRWIKASRADEIQAWLTTHQWAGAFVVLDDEDDGLWVFGERFVQTTFEDGLTAEKASQARECLLPQRPQSVSTSEEEQAAEGFAGDDEVVCHAGTEQFNPQYTSLVIDCGGER